MRFRRKKPASDVRLVTRRPGPNWLVLAGEPLGRVTLGEMDEGAQLPYVVLPDEVVDAIADRVAERLRKQRLRLGKQ